MQRAGRPPARANAPLCVALLAWSESLPSARTPVPQQVDANGNIVDSKFKTFGCGSAIASSSLATEWVKGRTIDDAVRCAPPPPAASSRRESRSAAAAPTQRPPAPPRAHCVLRGRSDRGGLVRSHPSSPAAPQLSIKNSDIAKHLSLPPVKLHCSMLAEDAIKARAERGKARRCFLLVRRQPICASALPNARAAARPPQAAVKDIMDKRAKAAGGAEKKEATA